MGLEQDDYRPHKTNVEKMNVLGEILKDREKMNWKEIQKKYDICLREMCESDI